MTRATIRAKSQLYLNPISTVSITGTRSHWPDALASDQFRRDRKSCRMYQNSNATDANNAREAATCWPMR